MSIDDIRRKTTPATKIQRLGIGVCVIVIIYCAGWFAIARQIETRIPAALAGGIDREVIGQCTDPSVQGFPFRIGIFCKSLTIDERRSATSISLGALRSAAQVYQPGRAVIEIDGPAEIRTTPGQGVPAMTITADWERLRASLRATLSGLEQTSLEYDRLAGTILFAYGSSRIGMTARHGELHLRQNGPDLDAAASIEALALADSNAAIFLPDVTASIDVTVTDAAGWLSRERSATKGLRGRQGLLRALMLDFGEGTTARLSGPYSVDGEGLVSGDFDVTLDNVEALRARLSAAFPDAADIIDNVARTMESLAGGQSEATARLTVRDSIVYLTIIPLFAIPAI